MNENIQTVASTKPQALQEAICWAQRKNFFHIIVEGDSKLTINDIQGKCEKPWSLRFILEDVRRCANSFQEVRWYHIFKEANFVVNALASISIKSVNLHSWDACILIEALNALLFDAYGTGCTRGSSI